MILTYYRIMNVYLIVTTLIGFHDELMEKNIK